MRITILGTTSVGRELGGRNRDVFIDIAMLIKYVATKPYDVVCDFLPVTLALENATSIRCTINIGLSTQGQISYLPVCLSRG